MKIGKKYKVKEQLMLFDDMFKAPRKVKQNGEVDDDDVLIKMNREKKNHRVVVFFMNGTRMGSWFTDSPEDASRIFSTYRNTDSHDDAIIMTVDEYYEAYGSYTWLRPELLIKSSLD